MPELFKVETVRRFPTNAEVADRDGKPHARVIIAGRSVWCPLTADGSGVRVLGRVWCANVVKADGRRERVRLSPNKDAASAMLAKLVAKIELEKAGVVDRFADHRKAPLTDHLAAWSDSLAASDCSPKYVRLKIGRVNAVFCGCGFVFPTDLDAEKLESFLHQSRKNGKVRGLGSVTRKEKLSVQSANHHLQAVKQLTRWMVANGRLDRCPFARLRGGSVAADVTLRRGEFAPAERAALLAATASSPAVYRGLTGEDRAMVYKLASAVGSGRVNSPRWSRGIST